MLELKSALEKNATLLILYFGPDKDNNKNNDFSVFLITLLTEKIINKDGYYDKKHILDLEYEVNVLKDFLRIYFKAEWKRANREVPDEKVQEYLEKHQLYIKIREIYQNGFEAHEEWVDNFYIQLKEKYNED